MEDILKNLTESQKSTLKEFQQNVKDFLTPDDTEHILVKFLRAKNFNLKATEKIFKENYYNRITLGINSILDTYKKPEVAEKYESTGVLGFAKDGTLVRYTASGRIDLYGYAMSMSCYEIYLYFFHYLESDLKMLKDQRTKTGKEIHEVTGVLDLEGFSIQQLLHKSVIDMQLDFGRLLQDCYPEVWGMLLVVNAPKFFDTAFNLLKPVLRTPFLEKIRIADKASTKDLLLEYIDEDVLPAFLGGKRVDSTGDPMCKEFISFGGKVPEDMYSQNNKIQLSPSDSDVKCFTIGRRSVHNICVAAHEGVTKMRTQIWSENGSIYFSIFYKEFGPDSKDLEFPAEDKYIDDTSETSQYKQVSSEVLLQPHCVQEDITFTLQWPGIYVLRFNNTGSWFTSRKLMVKYELFPPRKETTS